MVRILVEPRYTCRVMYPSATGPRFLVQYTVSGAGGRFNGAEYGRARLELNTGTPAIVLRVAAKHYGTDANNITLRLVDTGGVLPQTRVVQSGAAITVFLRRSALALLATAQEVAEAINAFTAYTSPAFAIRARAVEPLSTTPIPAVAATHLAGGVDPTMVAGCQYLWDLPSNAKAGLVDFEQTNPVWVTGFSSKFSVPSGTHSVTISRSRVMDDFSVVDTEKVPLFTYAGLTATTPDIAISDARLLLLPGQSLIVETDIAMTGFCAFEVTRAPEYPYA